jgi:undecaprenyl pyrophosphate phosphatase UppP
MHVDLIALYGGPDQVMTVTSALASIFGVLLIFWHKVVAALHKIMNKFRGTPAKTIPAVPQKDGQNS